MQNRKLGVDIGGVIIDRVHDNTHDMIFGDDYLQTPAVAKAFPVLRHFTLELFAGEVYIVSKCGQYTEERTREWLNHNRFYDITSIPSDHIYFCRERHEKAPICERLGITDFVDDRLEVLSYMTTVSNHYLFKPNPSEVALFARHLSTVTPVRTWDELREKLTASFHGSSR